MATSTGLAPSAIVLDTGEPVGINDHVYVSGWGEGQPWAIARVMEFVLAEGSDPPGSGSKRVEVRLAALFRPQDITSRSFSEQRILFASLTSSVKPLADIRGKCYVKHKDQIDDLSMWKQTPDHFFYKDFFDPYIKREFAIVPVTSLRNLPSNVHAVLLERYTFIVSERDMVGEVTGPFQTCSKCDEWASYATSVKCDTCSKSWHMDCLTPPLLSKPAKGYSWACAPCTKKHEAKISSNVASASSTTASGSKSKGSHHGRAGKAKATDGEMRYFKGWPFRYYGAFTFPDDTLDLDDPIFPRTASRLGTKFQTVVGNSTPTSHKAEGVPERGGTATVTLLGKPMDGLEAFMATVSKMKLPPPCKPSDLGVISRAVELYCKPAARSAKPLDVLKRSTSSEFQAVQFAEFEVEALRHSIDEKGGLEAHTAALETSRSSAECVRFYRVLRENDLRKRFAAIDPISPSRADGSYSSSSRVLPPSPSQREGQSHDDDMIYDPTVERGHRLVCSCCTDRVSVRWWKVPKSVEGGGLWCESCGQYFLRYANPPKQDVARLSLAGEKREGAPLTAAAKRLKTLAGGGAVTQIVRLPPCACCGRFENAHTLLRCSVCSLSVHTGCYGAAADDVAEAWKCDLCKDEDVREYNERPRCVFCPEGLDPSVLPKGRTKLLDDPGPFYALKPTIERNWAHVLCSAFIPGPSFTDPLRMGQVEGVHLVDAAAWTTPCALCNGTATGAVVKCADCPTQFHPSCALLLGYKFGFEITLVKSTRREIVTVTTFKGETGQLHAGIYCSKHNLTSRLIYDPYDIDPVLNLSALQVYCAAYKRSPSTAKPYSLLRRAEILDELLSTRAPPSVTGSLSVASKKACANCETEYSPIWTPLPSDPPTFLCHQCHHEAERSVSADAVEDPSKSDVEMASAASLHEDFGRPHDQAEPPSAIVNLPFPSSSFPGPASNPLPFPSSPKNGVVPPAETIIPRSLPSSSSLFASSPRGVHLHTSHVPDRIGLSPSPPAAPAPHPVQRGELVS